MLTAKQIEKRAQQFIESNPTEKAKIESLLINEHNLFAYFLQRVKENKPLIVSYILNFCFNDAEKRTSFGNRQDKDGNSAYHHAAANGFDDIIIILNDKRKFHNGIKFFSFVLENNQNERPLNLCCLRGNQSTFNLIWKRASKKPHNPMYALKSACLGGNLEIIKSFLAHPKFIPTKAPISEVCNAALEGQFGEAVKQLFINQNIRKAVTSKTKRKVTDDLTINNLFAEMARKQTPHKKPHLATGDIPASDRASSINQSTSLLK